MRCVFSHAKHATSRFRLYAPASDSMEFIFLLFLVGFLQHMVQAGVNPFPAGPGFTAAPTLNVTDGNLPVSVAVKNDALATALKPETSVNHTPSISVTQVSVRSASPRSFSF